MLEAFTRISALTLTVTLAGAASAAAHSPSPAHSPFPASSSFSFEPRTLDGSFNNRANPTWGKVGSDYQRLAPARYGDGAGALAAGPNPRYVSNRVFNALGTDLFSERNVSQWAWVWGQFLDHNFGLAQGGSEDASIPFSQTDRLERFTDDLGVIPLTRDAVAPGSGTSPQNPRQQVNTVNSYIDAWAVYGGTQSRLDWLRDGPGTSTAQAGASLMLPGGYLPTATARGSAPSAPSAPTMVIDGQLTGSPEKAVIAGDVRANENAELTSVHTLLAREHNRIVSLLPAALSPETRFQIARRVVGAEEQYITYSEFLPALGVNLPAYHGYDPDVNAELSDEFATAAYRAHSMVNGEGHIVVAAGRYTGDQQTTLEGEGVTFTDLSSGRVELTVPQGAAFFDPSLVPQIGLGPMLEGLADEPGYKNEEQIDDALRSVLFKIPGPGLPDPKACFEDPSTSGCFSVVEDLGAIDIQRARDHGIPTYNRLRAAVGLPPQTTFTQVTGERTDAFARAFGPDPINNPAILPFTSLRDLNGMPVNNESTRAVFGTRASTLAARLKAIYGSVNKVDAFVGMLSEPHVRGTEFGELQLALWRKQFQALRDGDRFFYLGDPVLDKIQRTFGITYRHTLAQLIALNTDVPSTALPQNVFFAPLPSQASPQ